METYRQSASVNTRSRVKESFALKHREETKPSCLNRELEVHHDKRKAENCENV